jgi:hypothetical protein
MMSIFDDWRRNNNSQRDESISVQESEEARKHKNKLISDYTQAMLRIQAVNKKIDSNRKIIKKDENEKRIIRLDDKEWLKILNHQRRIINTLNTDLELFPKDAQKTLRNNPVPELNLLLEQFSVAADRNKKIKIILEIQDILKKIEPLLDMVIKDSIKDTELFKEITEFSEQIKRVSEQKKHTKENIRKRREIKREQKLIKEIIVQIIKDEKLDTSADRTAARTGKPNPENPYFNPSSTELVTGHYLLSDDDYDQLVQDIKNLDRIEMLDLEENAPNNFIFLKTFSDEMKQPVGTNKTQHEEEKEQKQSNLQNLLLQLRKSKNFSKHARNLIKTNINSEDISLEALTNLLELNEKELSISERDGSTYLDLYTDVLLGSKFLHESGDKAFMGMYYIMMTMGVLNDDDYNPEFFLKKLTEYFIVDAYGKRRAQDEETDSGERSLVIEEVLTYYQYAKQAFTGSGEVTEQEIKNVEGLLEKFWWNEVGRPSIEYETTIDPETQEEIIVTDEYGPVVKRIYNQENIQYPVSREHGKYLLRKQVTQKAQERLHKHSQEHFGAITIYHQLQEMINGRRDRTGKTNDIGVEDVPLPPRDFYYVTVNFDNKWKKIKIDGDFFTTKKYGEHGSNDAIQRFLFQYTEEFYSEDNAWKDFKNIDKDLQEAYSVDKNYKEKYQESEERFSDLEDFTASDLGLYFMDESITQEAAPLMKSGFTNTFGGRKQMNIVMGVNKDGNITQVVEAVAHKYLDGSPARVESEKVLNAALNSIELLSGENPFAMKLLDHQIIKPEATYQEKNPTVLTRRGRKEQKNISHLYEGKIKGVVGYKEVFKDDGEPLLDENGQIVKEPITFRDQCNDIFSFYKEKLGVKIDKNTITQLAVHLVLGLTHTHFLASRDGILFPAMSFIPQEILHKIQNNIPLDKDDLLQLIAATQLLKADQKSFGIVPTNAMLTGAHSESANLRKLIQSTAEFLHKEVANPLTRSALVSSVSASRAPFPTDENFAQDFFTTALDGVYLDNGAFGFSDFGDDIMFTYRTVHENEEDMGKSQKQKNKEFNKTFNDALQNILQVFFNGMKEFETDLNIDPSDGWEARHKEHQNS